MRGGKDIVNIKLVGSNSKNGTKLRKNIDKIVKKNEIDINIELIDNNFPKYKIKQIPALIIDDKVISEGRVLTTRELEKVLI